MAAATGLPCRVDPALVTALRAQKSGKFAFKLLQILTNNIL